MGGKSDAPAAPDYIGQARTQAQGNLNLARAGAAANRIDQSTPYGTIKYTQGDGFDQSGYDAAMEQWRQNTAIWNDPNNYVIRRDNPTPPPPPNRNDFVINPDHWTSTIELSPQQQAQLDKQNWQNERLGWAGMNLSEQINQNMYAPMDISDIPGLIYGIGDGSTGDTWSKYSDLMMSRLNPDLDRQQAALDTKLANMGLTAGSEGWRTQQEQFGKQRNDANAQAQIAGANLAMQGAQLNNQTRQQAISERADLRGLPIKELQQIRSMAGITNPTFSQPGQQQLTAGADLLGASQSQYNAALGQVNAENAQAASNTQAGVGLASTAIMAAAFY